ncbi:MAG: hypothetical protein CBB61_006685 [Gammaproteobacteria bacterium TMED1]|nr:MAG: hypothetical protein CBB61_006685 [Gammaproteobacteria bacterium TMED1]|tara:strand:- start:1520 stop:2620 length:1101 start_codon:yes stop_codon:yes gene_type:complete
MDIYLVGGAVRDKLLGVPVTDKDWVVVGSNQKALLQQGYLRIGKDFPVFLHPKSKEEYALARTERKVGPLHTDFDCDVRPSITLEQDLFRRDLTINAIAQDEAGALIDPYGGQKDLRAKILRHVSPAFKEDPLRVLRVARFAARFPDFSVDASTMKVMREMAQSKLLEGLTPERVFEETKKALSTKNPDRYFELLNDINVNIQLWPELKKDDTKRLRSWMSDTNPVHSFTILTSSLNLEELSTLTKRLRFPLIYEQMSSLTMKIYKVDLTKASAVDIVNTLYELNAFRSHERFKEASKLAVSLKRLEGNALKISNHWPIYLEEAAAVNASSVDSRFLGAAIGKEIRRLQIERLYQLKLTQDSVRVD